MLSSVQLPSQLLVHVTIVFFFEPLLHLFTKWLDRVNRVALSFVEDEQMQITVPIL
jgi:hypothetical protein